MRERHRVPVQGNTDPIARLVLDHRAELFQNVHHRLVVDVGADRVGKKRVKCFSVFVIHASPLFFMRNFRTTRGVVRCAGSTRVAPPNRLPNRAKLGAWEADIRARQPSVRQSGAAHPLARLAPGRHVLTGYLVESAQGDHQS